MRNVPVSDVTIIAAVLGVFFLLMAFYKSIFHRRLRKKPDAADTADSQPVVLKDPFQQISLDQIPDKKQRDSYPLYLPTPTSDPATTSVFRIFNPHRSSGDITPRAQDTYEWE